MEEYTEEAWTIARRLQKDAALAAEQTPILAELRESERQLKERVAQLSAALAKSQHAHARAAADADFRAKQAVEALDLAAEAERHKQEAQTEFSWERVRFLRQVHTLAIEIKKMEKEHFDTVGVLIWKAQNGYPIGGVHPSNVRRANAAANVLSKWGAMKGKFGGTKAAAPAEMSIGGNSPTKKEQKEQKEQKDKEPLGGGLDEAPEGVEAPAALAARRKSNAARIARSIGQHRRFSVAPSALSPAMAALQAAVSTSKCQAPSTSAAPGVSAAPGASAAPSASTGATEEPAGAQAQAPVASVFLKGLGAASAESFKRAVNSPASSASPAPGSPSFMRASGAHNSSQAAPPDAAEPGAHALAATVAAEDESVRAASPTSRQQPRPA